MGTVGGNVGNHLQPPREGRGMSNLSTTLRQRWSAVRQRPLARNLFQLLLGSAFAQLLIAISTLLATGALGDAAYGQYAACYAIAALTSTAFNFGMDGWLLQQSHRDAATFDRFFSTSIAVRFLFGIPWLLLITLIAPLLNRASYPPDLVFILGASVWMDGLLAACHSYYKAKLQNQRTALLLITNAGGIVLLFMLCVNLNLSVAYFGGVRFGVTAVILGIALWGLNRGGHFPRPAVEVPLMLKAAVPFAFSELFYLIYMRADIAILGIRMDEHAVGIYAPASMLIAALFLIPSTLYTVMTPTLSRLLHPVEPLTIDSTRIKETLRRYLQRLFTVTILLGIGLTTVTGWFGPPVLAWLLPPEYLATGAILQILSGVLVFKSVSFALAAVLVAADRQAERTRFQAIMALLNATMTFLVIPYGGVLGVAWVYVFTEAVLMTGYAWLSWSWYHNYRKV
jgi:O-antigen/teichoic acid export membrane protein